MSPKKGQAFTRYSAKKKGGSSTIGGELELSRDYEVGI